MNKKYGESDIASNYQLDEQVGFLLRRATQRHLAIFSSQIPDITSTQFAALAKLCELGPTSQNALGRAIAMDAATVKGVVDRLRKKGLLDGRPDPKDQRRIVLTPTEAGKQRFDDLTYAAQKITRDTLAPLDANEAETLATLLGKLT